MQQLELNFDPVIADEIEDEIKGEIKEPEAPVNIQDERHKELTLRIDGVSYSVMLDVVADDEDAPYAVLAAFDADGMELARKRVAANFRLTRDSARTWMTGSADD